MGCVLVERVVLGMLDNNVYYLSDGSRGLLVDPSCKPERILGLIDGRPIDAIVLTHYHFDHVGAARELRRALDVPVYATDEDAGFIENAETVPGVHRRVDSCTVDVRVHDGEAVKVGTMEWKVMLTPGHSPGSMCWYAACPSERSIELGRGMRAPYGGTSDYSGILISGDTLFEGTHGRTDFEGGSPRAMKESLRRLSGLPDSTLVLPGHGNATTVLAEHSYALAPDFL